MSETLETAVAPAPASEAAPADPSRGTVDEPPPFLGTWRNVHLLVIGELVATAILFYALTRWAS